MTGSRSRWFAGALGGGLMLAAATPPGWFPGASLLVIAGLAVWYAIATNSARPLFHTYVFGCVHMACFSWSVHHVMIAAYAAIVVLGGGYFVLTSAMVRSLGRAMHVAGFAVGVGASFWLRAVMPEIYYPHGQPCHCLWQWPVLLGSLSVGGEPLLNALLGAIAAAFVEVWRSWRVGAPRWRSALLQFALVLVVAIGFTVAGHMGGRAVGSGRTISIAAVEPGVHPMDPYAGLSEVDARRRFQELFEQRLLVPTRALLAEAEPPDLILWPESSVPGAVEVGADGRLLGSLRLDLPSAPTRSRLLVGCNVDRDGGTSPAALLVTPAGQLLGHHEKRCLVPGGEFLPLVHWLPDGVGQRVHAAFRAALGTAPDCVPGRLLPPLATAAGVPFGALLCYDNAFPTPAAEQVAAGAEFLCVLSNEAWYRGGAELAQLAAMTVCRAVEQRTPVVRCTTDGWTLVVDAAGAVVASLSLQPAPTNEARILRTNVTAAHGRQRPMAWLAAATGPGLLGLLLLALAHAALVWARLRVARTDPAVPGDRGNPRSPARSGS